MLIWYYWFVRFGDLFCHFCDSGLFVWCCGAIYCVVLLLVGLSGWEAGGCLLVYRLRVSSGLLTAWFGRFGLLLARLILL